MTAFFLPVLKFPMWYIPLMKYILGELQAILLNHKMPVGVW